MKRIHKYAIKVNEPFIHPFHSCNRVIHFAQQHPGDTHLTMWMEEVVGENDRSGESRHMFVVLSTGADVYENHYVHRGTAICDGGSHVWHLYEVVQ